MHLNGELRLGCRELLTYRERILTTLELTEHNGCIFVNQPGVAGPFRGGGENPKAYRVLFGSGCIHF